MNWVMYLTSSSLFSILINGYPYASFSLSYGIRKGDPLFPFLFILMVESLGRGLKVEIREGPLKGLHLHGLDPSISNSMFMEDTMFMGASLVHESKPIKKVIKDFMAV